MAASGGKARAADEDSQSPGPSGSAGAAPPGSVPGAALGTLPGVLGGRPARAGACATAALAAAAAGGLQPFANNNCSPLGAPADTIYAALMARTPMARPPPSEPRNAVLLSHWHDHYTQHVPSSDFLLCGDVT